MCIRTLCTMTIGIIMLSGCTAMGTIGMLAEGVDQGRTETLYSADGLVVKGTSRRQTNPATGQHHAWVDYTMTFASESLCGRNVAALLFPDDDFPSTRGFYCPQNVMVLPQDGVVAFFSSNSSKSPVLAHVRVVDGELAVTRLDVSPDPKRNSLYSVRFLDARLPGWRRVQTGWRDTVLLRLSPFKVVLLGEGELLDVDGEVAFLLVRPGKKVVSPEKDEVITSPDGMTYVQRGEAITTDVPMAFRAVQWRDGQELARLDVNDICQDVPRLELEGRDSAASLATGTIRYADVPAWRKRTVSFLPGPTPALQLVATDAPCISENAVLDSH